MRLRPKSIGQVLGDAFQSARPAILQLGQDVKAGRDSNGRGKKRKWEYTDFEEDDEDEEIEKAKRRPRRIRPQNQSRSASQEMSNDQDIEDEKYAGFQPGEHLSMSGNSITLLTIPQTMA